ncbi:MAG: isopeptide-forming domain-containing fimbrial protein [Acidobacteria bacterium]|nr:isopeptide-forming domain-containing fimbrial protein [Acidobacteriota bacterium]
MPPAPLPQVSLNVPQMEFPSQALIGEVFCYTARFDNMVGGGVGYGPYVEIILPPGLTIDKAGLGGVCDTGDCDENDFYQLPVITGPSVGPPPPVGYTVYLIKAPIGSLYSTEPFIDLKICIKVDENIALGVPLTVCHTPVFEFGGNPLGGIPISGTPLCPTVTPTVVILNKRAQNYTSNKLPPSPTVEVPTGQCNTIAYELVANIADTKMLTTIHIADQLPAGMTLVNNSVTILNSTGGNTNCTNYGSNFVCADIPTETGSPGMEPYDKEDIIIRYEAFVNNTVLSPNSCASTTLTNTATLDAQYNSQSIPQQTADLLIEVEHVTLQKSASGPTANDPLHVMPGDLVNYSLKFQVSENITANNVVITDTIPDGIDVPSGSTFFATLQCAGSPTTFVPITNPSAAADGTKTLTINLGTLTPCRNCTLTFSGTVQETYRASPAGRKVLASDSLIPVCDPLNPSALKCTKISYNLPGVLATCTDDTAGGVIVKSNSIGKELVGPVPPDGFKPGDQVTFKLKMCVNSGDTKSVEFTDYLPSPVFKVASVSDITPVMITQTSGPPVSLSVTPTVSASDNSVKFVVSPTLITNDNPSATICFEVKFSVYVTYEPFADDLFLTNLITSKNVKTNGEEEGHLTGVIVHVRAPKLKVTKGVFDTDNSFADNLSQLPGPQPYNKDAQGVDANDKVTYYVTVENEGGAPAVGVNVTDTLPPGLMIVSYPMAVGGSPTPGITCKLSGNPTPCPAVGSTIPPDLTVDAFYGGNSLPAGQSWIFKIEVMLPTNVVPCQNFVNSASATWSSAYFPDIPPGAYSTPFPSTPPDSATITTAYPTITKTIVSTSQAHTTGTDVAIGEKVKYLVHIRVPEGTFTTVKIEDVLDSGLAVADSSVTAVAASSNISGTPPIISGGSLNGVISNSGGKITFNLGTVNNSNTINGDEEYIEFMYEAVVLNVTGNVQGTMLNNTVTWTSDQCNPPGVSAVEPVKVVEPKLQITKTAVNAAGQPITSADAGDEIFWMITVTNQSPSTAGAFSVLLTDSFTNGYVANSLMVMGGNNNPTSINGASGVLMTVNWNEFPLNATSVLKFRAILTSAFSCSPITNQANVSWASIPPTTPQPISPHNSNSCRRTGPPLTGCGQLNNYITAGTGLVPVPSPTLAKTVKSTSEPQTTGNNVTIGEDIIYELKVSLHEGTTSSLTLTDALPAGLSAVSATVVTTNGISGLPASFAVTTACTATTQTFNFPNPLTVPADNITTNNFFTVDLKVKVCDGASGTLNNTATLAVTNCPSVESSVPVVVVKPNLDIKKQFSASVAAPNSTVQITITVTNNGTSPAYEVLLQDVLNGCLSFVSATASPGFTAAQNGGSVTVTGASLNVGSTATITITAQVGDCCSVPNTVTGSASTLSGVVTEERTVTGSGSDTLIVKGTDCPCYDLTQPSALGAWYSFDETSGTTSRDIGGIVNNLGTFGAGSTAPAITSGIVKNALLFDGNDDYVQAANENELNIRGACNTNDAENYTIDAWIQSDGVGTQTIVDKRVGGVFTGYIFFLNSGRLAIQINGQNYATPTTLPVLTDNQWHFVAVTVQRCPTPEAKFYVDGELVHLATLNASASNSMVNSEPLYIGTRSLSVGVGAAFKGKLDELEIFKRVLSEPELDQIYAAGSGGKCKCVTPPQNDSMVSWWPLNELVGDTTVYDLKFANHGVQVPAGALGSPNVTPITGVVNGAFRFPLANQADKYIEVPDNAALDFGTGSLTIEAWFRPISPSLNLVHAIVDKLDADSNSGYAFYVQNQQLKFVLGGNFLSTFNSSAVITLNEWQHVAVVVDRGTNSGRFVRNGVTVGTFTPTPGNSDNNFSLRIGGSRIGFPQPSFATTDLDELEFFKAALTNAELATLYNAGGMGKCFPGCAIIPATLPEAIIGSPYSQQLTLTGCAGTVIWTISGGSLPQGMILNPTTGVLSGTVNQATAGNVTITVKATCSTGCMVTKDYLFSWAPCIYVINPLSANYGSSGGTGSVSLTTGILCNWVAVSNDAWVSITAGASGTGNGTINYSVAPNPGNARVGTLTIGGQTFTVNQSGICPVTVNPATIPNGTVGTVYSQTFTATGGTGPYTFARVTGTLPPGLTLATGGALTGTPTAAGTYNFTVQATASNGCTGSRSYSLTIGCPTVTVNPATIANGAVGTVYSQTFTATGGAAPYTFARVTGTLPPGLTLATGGALTGTPTTAGTFTFTVQATDSGGCTGTRDYTVIISASGLQFYPLATPMRVVDTRPNEGNCDNVSAPIAAGTSLTTLARITCGNVTIPATARAIVGNITVINQTSQAGYLTLYPDGVAPPLAANMIYGPNGILANNFTVGLSADGRFNVFGERTIHIIVDISGYFAPPATEGLYFHPLARPVRITDTRVGLGNCDSVNAPIAAGTSLTTQARITCEGLTIPSAARAIIGNVTVINGSGQTGYLTIYPNGIQPPLAANMIYFPGQILSNAFTVGLGADGRFDIFAERTIDVVVDVAGYYSTEATDINGTGLLLTPLSRPLRVADTRAAQGNCDNIGAPITGGTSLGIPSQLTCEGITIPNTARAVLGNVTVINLTSNAGFLTLYPDGVTLPLAANMIYFPGQVLANAFVVGLNPSNGQFRIYAERTLEAIVDVSGYFAP